MLYATGAVAEPYYSAYINADCKLYSELSANYRAPESLSPACQQVNAMVDAINKPYTGTTNAERLAWLKTRRLLLTQRANTIAQAVKDLGGQDLVDHTALDVRSISGLVGGLTALVPGVGTVIGGTVALLGNVIGGLIDTTSSAKAQRDNEIALYKVDYDGLMVILNAHNQEYDRLNMQNYLMWGGLIALVIILIIKRKMKP